MLELASAGSKVMQSRSVEFAKKYGVIFEVRSSFNHNPGTIVKEEVAYMEQVVVRGVAVDKDQAKVIVSNILDQPGSAAKVFRGLADANIIVDMIVQNVGRHGVANLTFTVPQGDTPPRGPGARAGRWPRSAAARSTVHEQIAKLSVVGVGMKTHSGVAATLFQALADAGINIELISTSEIKISVVIGLDRADEAARVGPRGLPAGAGLKPCASCRRAARPRPCRFPTPWRPAWRRTEACICRKALPDLRGRAARLGGAGLPELCADFLRRFATDIPPEVLGPLVAAAYTGFSDPAIAPLRQLGPKLRVLELFHGPTLAFKDFALQVLGNLYARQCAVRHETINVLGATSGDTGAAAIHGLIGRPGTAIFILYPDGRVSPLQERQMACTGAANVFALAVAGSFDDAQATREGNSSATRPSAPATGFRRSTRSTSPGCSPSASTTCTPGCACRPGSGPTSNSSCPPAISATSSPVGCCRKWACRSPASRWRPTRTTSSTGSSRPANTGPSRCSRAWPRRWTSRPPPISSASSTTAWTGSGAGPRRDGVDPGDRACVFPHFDRDTFTASRCADAEIPGIIRRVYTRTAT